ncbi:MAG: hypothetical protein FWD88_01930 [Treponema sp.]|nr:hypothetical protein [Treponema sp.]
MDRNEWKPVIREYLKRYPACSFAHISELEGAEGDRVHCLNKDENIVLWINLNGEFINALVEMEKEEEIVLTPVLDTLGMLLLGGSLNMPLIKLDLIAKYKKHKTEHWLPVIIDLTEKGKSLISSQV